MSIYSAYLKCKGAKVFKSKWKYAFNWRTRQIDWEWAFDHPGEGLYQIGMPKVHGDYLWFAPLLFGLSTDRLLKE